MFLFLGLLLALPPHTCLTGGDIMKFILQHLLRLGNPSPGLRFYFSLGTFTGQSVVRIRMLYLQQRIFQEIHLCHLHILALSLPSRGESVMFGEDETVRQRRTLVGDSDLHTKDLSISAPGGEALNVVSAKLVVESGQWADSLVLCWL